jgi:hypothetical protein
LIESQHTTIVSPHPSPLSASRGFFGSKPFSRTNEALESFGVPGIEWACLDQDARSGKAKPSGPMKPSSPDRNGLLF